MEEKKSGSTRLTIILGLAFGAVVLAVAIPVVIGTGEPDEELVSAPAPTGMVTAPAGQASGLGNAKVVPPSRDPTRVDPNLNSWCKSYVFSRCNAMKIPGRDCLPIAETGGGVQKSLGIAGCRQAVDDLLLAEAERGRRNGDIVEEAIKAAMPSVPALEPWTPKPGSEVKPLPRQDAAGGVEAVADAGQNAGGPRVVMRPPNQAQIDEGMTRIRQLEEEIAVQRNTFVGTNIGVQSRLDEMREIASKLDTEEAKGVYNKTLDRVGATASPPPPGSTAVESAPVQAAPASF